MSTETPVVKMRNKLQQSRAMGRILRVIGKEKSKTLEPQHTWLESCLQHAPLPSKPPEPRHTLLESGFQYEPLPSHSSFRVIELLPGSYNDQIQYRLHVVDWTDPIPYEAVSYAWGDNEIKVPTICNGRELHVTPNLRDGLRNMRLKSESRYLWADAACIDQTNPQERGHQVENMRQIYQKSTGVIVWLGEDEDGHRDRAFAAMEEIASSSCLKSGTAVNALGEIDDLFAILPIYQLRGLESDNSASWQSLRWFFSLPWFTRLWVFQEVNSKPDVRMICGTSTIPWDIVAFTATYLRGFGQHFATKWNLGGSHHVNAYMMRDRKLHGNLRLPELLTWARYFETTNPLDKVYAMMGMPQFAQLSPPLEVSYAQSKQELYREVTTRCILELQQLDVLGQVQHNDWVPEHLPSWIPEWDEKTSTNPIQVGGSSWNTAGGSDVSATVAPTTSVLKIAGFCFDTVEASVGINTVEWFRLGEFRTTYKPENHPLMNYHYPNDPSLTRYCTGESFLDVLAMVLVTGYYHEQLDNDSQELCSDFTAFVKQVSSGCSQDMSDRPASKLLKHRSPTNGSWLSFQEVAIKSCYHRSIYTTKRGYIGIGPNAMQVGDICCVLLGGSIPFILREKEGYHQLVGDAYLHGIMKGEAMKGDEAGEFKEQIFEIH
jgi:hypothetical protein